MGKVPKLRFKEFSGEWEKKKLGEIGIKIIDGDRGVNYPNGNDFSNNEYCLFLNAKNVTKGGFSFNEVSFITKEKDESLRKGKLQRYDIVLTTRGSVGHISYYDLSVPYEHLRINSGMVLIRTDAKTISHDYLFKYFNSNQIQNEIKKISFGSAQPQLTVGEISKLKVCFPTSIEQTKIAIFLTAIDTKIDQLTRKKELLGQYKKGVMQKIFSQELRFKADDGNEFPEWEEKKLKILTKIYDGTHTTPDYVENGIPFYSVEHLTSNNFKNTKYISEEVFEKENKRVKLEKYDILMTRIGDIGTSRLLDWDVKASFYVSLALIKNSNLLHSSFLNQQIKSSYFQRQLHNKTLHVAFPKKINLGEIGDCTVMVPVLNEQSKIANFLSAIDTKIDFLTKQLDEAKNFKKGLLQQMFV